MRGVDPPTKRKKNSKHRLSLSSDLAEKETKNELFFVRSCLFPPVCVRLPLRREGRDAFFSCSPFVSLLFFLLLAQEEKKRNNKGIRARAGNTAMTEEGKGKRSAIDFFFCGAKESLAGGYKKKGAAAAAARREAIRIKKEKPTGKFFERKKINDEKKNRSKHKEHSFFSPFTLPVSSPSGLSFPFLSPR